METLTLICPCHFGLESVLAGEIRRIGGENLQTTDGRVEFTGDFSMLARANLCLRTAERVLIKLAAFKAYSFDDLFEGVKAAKLEDFIGREDAFPVKGHCLNSKLHSVPDCQSIVKKAAAERLKAKYGVQWLQETGPVHQLQFSILKDMVTLMLDTSGAGLHKRGYRANSNMVPIKETLAAGILDLARIYPDTQFYDPFCGSGTFLIEAAMKAYNIPPGIKRMFAAQKWAQIPEEVWRLERERGLSGVRKGIDFQAFGSDINPAFVELSRQNAKKAGVSRAIALHQADIRDFSGIEKGLIVCNPPYGVRMLEQNEARTLYSETGKVINPNRDLRFYIITADDEFESFFGKKADKRRKLYNGMLKCQLYMYFQ